MLTKEAEEAAFEFARSQGLTAKLRAGAKMLPVPITDHEVADLATRMLEIDAQREQLEADAKDAQKRFKNKIGGLVDDKEEIAKRIRSRAEDREVGIVEGQDEAGLHLVRFRLDTKEEIERRPLSLAERQLELADAQGNGEDDPDEEDEDLDDDMGDDDGGDEAIDLSTLDDLPPPQVRELAKRLGVEPKPAEPTDELKARIREHAAQPNA